MEVLADTLADEPDGSVRTVARALANRVLKLGVKFKTEDGRTPYEVLSDALGWYLGFEKKHRPGVSPSSQGLGFSAGVLPSAWLLGGAAVL